MRCWKDRWEGRHLVLAITALVFAFVVGAAVLVQEYSSPTLVAALRR